MGGELIADMQRCALGGVHCGRLRCRLGAAGLGRNGIGGGECKERRYRYQPHRHAVGQETSHSPLHQSWFGVRSLQPILDVRKTAPADGCTPTRGRYRVRPLAAPLRLWHTGSARSLTAFRAPASAPARPTNLGPGKPVLAAQAAQAASTRPLFPRSAMLWPAKGSLSIFRDSTPYIGLSARIGQRLTSTTFRPRHGTEPTSGPLRTKPALSNG